MSDLPKSQILRVRCARKEKDAWRQAARQAGLTLSEWIRNELGRVVAHKPCSTEKRP